MASLTVNAAPFLAGLTSALKDYDHQAEAVVGDTGEMVVGLAQGFAPRGATGELEGSISAEPGRDARGPFVIVGTTLDYGFYQEFGTRHMPAHPFMRPALAQAGAVLQVSAARSAVTGRSSGLRRRGAQRSFGRRATRGTSRPLGGRPRFRTRRRFR